MIEETRRINEKTGEVVRTKVRNITVAFDPEKGYLFWVRKSHSRTFAGMPYPDSLKHAELGKLTLLAQHMWAGTNMLGYRGHGGVRPCDVAQIGRIIGLKEYQAGVFVRKMIRLGMLARVEVKTEGRQETQFYMNPIHFANSNRLSLNLYLIFHRQLDKVLPEWVKSEFMRVDGERKRAQESAQ